MFCFVFMQGIWEVVGDCYINQGLGNGKLHNLCSISCPHKAEL